MAAISSLSCFAFKAAAPTTAAGPAYRHLSSLLRTNSATSFHKIPTLRSVGRQPAAEAAPFWPRPAAEYVAAKVGGSQEPEKSPAVAVVETPPAGEEVTPAPAEEAPATEAAETEEEVTQAAAEEAPATEAAETEEEVTQAAAEEAPATQAAAAVKEEESTEAGQLTKKLVELLEGTDRGLKASSETTAEILEVISQLEAINPTPAPTEALALLNGKWILAYTSYSQLVPLLRSVRLPELVKVVEISQTFDAENFTVQNAVKISGLLITTSVTTTAKFEVQSPKRVQIKFEEGSISTPQLTDAIVVPEGVDLLGQHIDFSPLKNAMGSVQDAAARVAKSLSSTFPGAAASVEPLGLGSLTLKFPIAGNLDPNPWLLTTYLDESLRISRGGDSSVYVLFKDASA